MNEEFLAALERLEREKGISKEVIFAAIESALTSAAVKIMGHKKDVTKEDITVKMDKQTGEITIYQGDEVVESDHFGRIAAQTAKQVMIQKIREAERDVISEKYLQMKGDIISGSVHRFERGSIIVELDDTEAVVPKSEQIPRERFRQGQPIKAYLKKVERKPGGVDIVLSRADENFVKKLFENEVPEISQGIVQIRSIARDPGERTKVAVSSSDDKIDAVGACVGMRGARVKEVVRELSGERVDIVRWNDDLRQYITNAVSPVEILSMEIDREANEVRLLIPKDQLALLIGKKGRNIRVTSKLVGWEIKAGAESELVDVSISDIGDLDDGIKGKLLGAGCTRASKVLELGAEKLVQDSGFDEETATAVINACQKALEDANKEALESGEIVKDDIKSLGPEEAKKQESPQDPEEENKKEEQKEEDQEEEEQKDKEEKDEEEQ